MHNGIVCIRGLPGSGKSTLAAHFWALYPHGRMAAADEYFMRGGKYVFDSHMLSEAHAVCKRRVYEHAHLGPVFVHNTFSTEWELGEYAIIASRRNVPFNIVDLFDAGLTDEELAARNVHGVPVHTIARMRERWYNLTLKFL